MIYGEQCELTPKVRHALGGSYAELSNGVTHYALEGNPDGLPLMLLHGGSVPSWQFDLLIERFENRREFHTLRFDFYGHGYSDRPNVRFDTEVFVNQAIELVDKLNFPRPMCIIGHSMGGAVASRLVAARPEWFTKVVLNAPMLDYTASLSVSPILKIPLVGEIFTAMFMRRWLIQRRRRRYGAIGKPQFTEKFLEQLRYRGFWRSLLSMVRDGALGDQSDGYRALQATGKSVQLLWGTEDTVVRKPDIDTIVDLTAPDDLHRVPGLEHNLLFTHPELVESTLRAFVMDAPDTPVK